MRVMIFANDPNNYREYDDTDLQELDRFYIVNGISYLKENYKLEQTKDYIKLTQKSLF